MPMRATTLIDTQNNFSKLLNDAPWCASFPAPDAIGVLATRGVDVAELAVLVECLARIGRSWDFRNNRLEADHEKMISEKSRELAELLNQTRDENGWRHAWDGEYQQLEASVEVDRLTDDLETLARAADQRAEQFLLATRVGIHPRSGKIQFFYWMSLLAFWKFVLGREVRTSDNGKNRKSGPLVAFIETMSVGMTDTAVTPGAIRKFVERHRDEVEKFGRTFLPPLTMRMHFLASGR